MPKINQLQNVLEIQDEDAELAQTQAEIDAAKNDVNNNQATLDAANAQI